VTEMPVVAYAAKSTPDEKDSTGQQIAAIIQAVDAEPGRFFAAEPGTFTEDDVSGFRGNRGPRLEAAMRAAVNAAAKYGRAELWVWATNRLGRGSGQKDEARSYLEVWAQLQRQGVQVRSVSDDSFTRAEFVGIASVEGNKYAQGIRDSVRRAKTDQHERGERLGGPVPDGYLLAVERDARDRVVRREYVIDPAREPVIRRMIELALEGWGQPTISRKLNAEGFRTARNEFKTGRVQEPRPFTRRRVQDTLTNPFYAGGIVRYRSNRYRAEVGAAAMEVNWSGSQPTYLAREDHDAIQAAFGSRDRAKAGRPQSGQPTRRHALHRLAECATCGERMYAETSPYKRKDGTHARRYVCANVKFATGLCDGDKVDAERVDAWIVDDLHALTFDFDAWLANVTASDDTERLAAEAELADVQERQMQQAKRIRKLEATILRWIEEGQDDRADALADTLANETAKVARLERAADNLRVKLAEAPDHRDEVDATLDWWNTVRRQILGAKENARSLGDVNDLLHELFTAFRLRNRLDGTLYVEPVLRMPVDVARHPWDSDDLTTLVSDTFDVPVGAAHPVLLGNPRNAQA